MRRIALIASLLSLCLTSPAGACLLRVRQHADPAALMRGPDGRLSGPQVETVREALRRIGCRMEVVSLPWARALRDLEAGRLDVLPDAHRAADRERFAWFSSTSWPATARVFMRAADLADGRGPRSLEEFADRRLQLGLQVGARYGQDIDSLLADERFAGLLVRTPSRQSLWKMLALKRIDGVLTGEITGRRELRQLGLNGELAPAAIRLAEEPSHTAFSRATVDAALVARFDAALEAMRRDGTAARIEAGFELPE